MNESLVIIPTYDEKDNVRPIAAAVHAAYAETDILFVDDNSPDGTGPIIDELREKDPRINVLHQKGKAGLGRAYINGFKWGLERDYKLMMEMDADFSHDPSEIVNFHKAIQNADMVLGTRYRDGIRITNWPLSRLILSKTAATYVRLITGLPVTDPTGGFKCFRREVLEAIDLDKILSNGYAFQIEMSYGAWMRGFRIGEIPITFVDRRSGYSKMSSEIVTEAWQVVWKLAFRNRFRRKPSGRAAG
jgi:dolichol-phosphate mannosyltransferase